MKKNICKLLLIFCLSIIYSACSRDKDDDVQEVKHVKSVAGANLFYENGVVQKIVTKHGQEITFDYQAPRKSTSQFVKMTIIDVEGSIDKMFFDMELNSNGYIKNATETYGNSDKVETWEFTYNMDGQLIKMKRSEGGNEITTIQYQNGNISEVSMKSDEVDNKLTSKIFYTTDQISVPIENKNNIMLFDENFDIDMDEMKYAYWAGLLGTSTKHLPLKTISSFNDTEESIETFQWIISNNYVQKMIKTYSVHTEEYLFSWE